MALKTAYKEFLKGSVKQLAGDQDDYRKHAMKHECRRLLNEDAKARKLARKRVKKARRGNR